MNRLRRAFMGSILGALLALTMGASQAPLAPVPVAKAAGVSLYVDDGPSNNGSVRCPDDAYPTIQAAKAALGTTTSNVTITVCPGYYSASSNQASFYYFTNLKLIGKGGPTISAGGFNGTVFYVVDSSKVTISGFQFNGSAAIGGSGAKAIVFSGSSGTIKGNLITDWHQDYNAPLTGASRGISVETYDLSQKVTIDRNTLFDVQDIGIRYLGPAKAKITKNRVVMHSDVEPADDYLSVQPVQAGVLLARAAAGSQVSGNVIEGNTGMEPFPCPGICPEFAYSMRGVMLLETSGVKVTGNTVSHALYGISVETWCYHGDPIENADGNTISGNKLYNNRTGIYVNAANYRSTPCSAHADNNTIKANKIDRNSVGGGLYGVRFVAGASGSVAGNKLTSNTFTGFLTSPVNQAWSTSGLVADLDVRSNKTDIMPLTGVLR